MKMDKLCDNEISVHRFFCNCHHPAHVLELSIWRDGQIEVAFYHDNYCGRKLWDRIKMAFGLVFGKSAPSWSEFIIAQDDREEISKIISPTNEG